MCLRGAGAPGECALRVGEWAGRTGPGAVGRAWASRRDMKAMGGRGTVTVTCVLQESLCTCTSVFVEQYSR